MTTQRFRKGVVFASLALTLVASIGSYAWDALAGRGMLVGGTAGVLAFWLGTGAMAKLAVLSPDKAISLAYKLTASRAILYAAVLAIAYTWDPTGLRCLWATAAGLLIVRFVTLALGLVKLRRPPIAATGNNACHPEV